MIVIFYVIFFVMIFVFFKYYVIYNDIIYFNIVFLMGVDNIEGVL